MATTTSMQRAAAAHFGYNPPAPSAPSGGTSYGSSGGSTQTPPPIYSNPSELPVGSPGYNPAWTPQGGGSLPAGAATITGEEYLAAGFYGGQTISPIVPKAITPESSIAGIQSVFGDEWQSSLTPEIQAKGIYGAVRIKDTNEVYSLGTGGSKAMSAADYFNTFKTDEQGGIVDEISKEQAVKLGIPLTGKTPVATNAITTEALSTKAIDLEIGTEANISEADGFKAYMEEYLKQQESLKSQSEKDTEKKVDDITTQLEGLLKDGADQGAIQAAEEEKREIEDQQKLVDDANGDLSMKMAEIDALAASYNLENQVVEGKTISLARMQGQQAQNYKMYLAQKNLLTSEAGLLQAKALALQGKLDSAQTAADRATDLKYSSWVTEVNNATSLLTLLEGKLSKDETIRADAMKVYYDRIDTQIAEQKATEKANYTTLLSQMNQYPDANIQLTDTLEQANAKITANSAIYRQQTRLADGTGGTGGGDEQYEALNKDLTKEVQNLFDGDYGTEGAREKLIAKLQTFARINYPELVAEIPKMVYGTDGYEAILPDGYEAELTKSTPFSGIPSFEDIQ